MSIITFNASTEGNNKKEMAKIKQPFQIMPGGRSKLSSSIISSFPEMKNENILIHVSYMTRPFSDSSIYITKENLKHYVNLCKKLGTKNILIHFPTNIKEYSRFSIGLEMIINILTKNNIICNFEIAPFSKELREYLEINKDNAYEKTVEYIDELFEQIPKTYIKMFKFVPDTAHLYVNGIENKFMIDIFEKYKSKISFVHLNGNKSVMFSPDKHIPIYKSNRIENVDEIMKYLSKTNYILIAENSTEKGRYSEWVKFAEKYKISIVDDNEVYSV